VALVGRLTARHPMNPLHLTAIQTVLGTVLFLVPTLPHLPQLAHGSAVTFAELAYLALFCSVFAFLAQTWAVQRTSASRASLLLGTEPVWAVAIGITLGGERLTLWASLGAALMVAGTYWGQSIERRHRGGAEPAEPLEPAEPVRARSCPGAGGTEPLPALGLAGRS
jgi:drug/metabolite transporter (DMT)-like permease